MRLERTRGLLAAGALCLALPLVNGCAGRVAENAETLKADVLLVLGGTGGADMTCRMLEKRRDGVCSFRLESFEAEALVSRLHLTEINLKSEISYGVLETLARTTQCHKTVVPPGASGFRGYGTYQRPAELKLEKGGRFEYLFLFRAEGTGETCLQVSYAES